MEEILIVEDESALRYAMRHFLENFGYVCRTASDGRKGVASFRAERPDLVLLDVLMPKMDGFAVCAEIRALDREVPILFLTSDRSPAAQIRGLEFGADDFLTKDVTEEVLLARIRAALARTRRFSAQEVPDGLTKIEADIYRLLKSDRGRYFTYREIFSAILGEGYYADEGSIRTHISHLRSKLPPGMTIGNIHGRGYCLT